MHTGYDNWICQIQEPVLNLQKKDSLKDGISLNSYQVQNGSHMSHLNGFLAPRNTPGLLGDFPSSQCVWTSTICNRATRPYNYQNKVVRTQQNGCCFDWSSLGCRNDLAQALNHVNQKSQENVASQTPRIRVRDVNSLNNIAQNAAQKNQFDCFNQRTAQQSITEHANYIPSLFEVDPFQPPHIPRPKKTYKTSSSQERFSLLYQKQKEQLSRCQYNMDKSPAETYGRPDCLQTLQTLLGRVDRADVPRPAESQQSFQTVNSGLNAPPTASGNNDHTLSSLLRGDYSMGQSSYRNPPLYPGNPQLPVRQNSQPFIEPVSPPVVDNVSQTNQTIRVTAVISVPDLSRKCDASQSVPGKENSKSSSPTKDTNETATFISEEVPPSVVPDPENCLNVKKEATFASEVLNDSNIEIVIQTIKTEDILEQDEQNVSDKNSTVPSKDKNHKFENCENKSPDQTPGETLNTKSEDLIKLEEIKSEIKESNYKSQINRDKLDRLIEFLQGKNKNSQQVQLEKPQKEKKDASVKKIENLNKITKVKSSPQSPQIVNDECPKEETLNLEKQSEAINKSKTANEAKKSSHGGDNQVTDQGKQAKGNESKQKSKRKSKPENRSSIRESQTPETPAEKSKISENNKEKTEADVSQRENAEENQFKEPKRDINQNEKTNKTSATVKKEVTVYLDPPSPWNAEQLEKDLSKTQKDSARLARANCVRVFPNFNFHFCNSCNLVSPIESFWINAVTGELKCLNCFKRMNLNAIQTAHNVFSEGRDPETNKEPLPEIIHLPRNDAEKQRRQSVGKEEKHRKEDTDRRRPKSLDKPEACANKTKSHCPVKKSFSTDECLSPKEERSRKYSVDHAARCRTQGDLFPKWNRKTESNGVRKRMHSKDDHWPRKIRVMEESEEERMDPEKTVKYFESFKKIKETDDAEKKRKSITKDNKKTKDNEWDKISKPLKEKQNTKAQSPNKESGRHDDKKKETEKKKEDKKSEEMKDPLQYKDSLLNKSSGNLTDVMDIFAPSHLEKEDEKSPKFFSKLKKKAKKLSLNLIKEAAEGHRSAYWKLQ